MNNKKQKLGAFPFVIGGLSFIPLIGVFFGIIAIIIGVISKKVGRKALIIMGSLGICFTIIIYGSLFYFGTMKRGGVYDDLRLKLTQTTITQLTQAVELYNVQNGRYPISLEELKQSLPENSMIFINDPSSINRASKQEDSFYYKLSDNHKQYYLLSVGEDGQPFTEDDILPDIKIEKGSKIGLRFK